MTRPLAGRIALVTGASRGIGKAAAVGLAAAGAHVICLARTVGGLEAADDEIRKAGGAATLVPLNIRDFEALDRLGGTIFDRWGRLDAFLGNAGSLGVLTPLDPLLRQSDAGRVLFVTSGAARHHTPFWGGYGMAKAALESLALTYAEECATTKVRVNLLSPGAVRTGMRAKAMPGEDPQTLPAPEALVPLIVDLLSPSNRKNGELVVFSAKSLTAR
jgi:NAD(P)-dependent dehydrogenase (short-subunit alcohol dehydrogenase family)